MQQKERAGRSASGSADSNKDKREWATRENVARICKG